MYCRPVQLFYLVWYIWHYFLFYFLSDHPSSFICSFGSYRFLSEEKYSTLDFFFTIYQPTLDIFLYQQSYR